jgi:hypothetical protein
MMPEPIWALRHADGTWRSPDHYVSSRTSDPKQAKPFYGDSGKFYAELFLRSVAGEVVPHPHPEIWA